MRFIDSAQIVLKENTEFELIEYKFDGNPGTPHKITLKLIRGGLRTITGSVGEKDHDNYQLITPDTYVNIQGTTYTCVVEKSKTICGVSDGGITLTNLVDSVLLGLGGDYDYAEVESRQSPHIPLLFAPDVLNQITINEGNNQPTITPQDGTISTSQRTPISVTPLTNGVSFPTPQTIRVIPYKK